MKLFWLSSSFTLVDNVESSASSELICCTFAVLIPKPYVSFFCSLRSQWVIGISQSW